MINFIKQHWTWLLGVIGVIWTAISPSLATWLAGEAMLHPTIGVVIAALVAFLAHVSPSPLSKG